MPKLKIKNDGSEYEAPEDTSLLDLCLENESCVPFGCMAGACGTCRIRVVDNVKGLSEMEDLEREFLKDFVPDADDKDRLACQCRLAGDVTIAVVDTGQHNFPGDDEKK